MIEYLDAEMIIKEKQNNTKIILFNDYLVTKLLANPIIGRSAALPQASVVPLLSLAYVQVEDQLAYPTGGQVLKKT